MNVKMLNAAMQFIDDQYLDIADAPQKEITTMKKTKTITRIFLIAAVVAMLAVTAYAADLLNVQSLVSYSGKTYGSYQELKDALDSVGYQIDAPEVFENGFRFQNVRTREVSAQDENNSEVMHYQTIYITYLKNDCRVVLNAQPYFEELYSDWHSECQSREYNGVTVKYVVDHYKNVPDDYVPTEADKEWEKQPGNYISYGSDEIEEISNAFASWVKDGIYYSFMDAGAKVTSDTLFAMAEELINN